MAQDVRAGDRVAVASALTVFGPAPSTCMNHGAMLARVTVQRTYLVLGAAAPAATQALPADRPPPKLTFTSASAMAVPWNPILF